MSTPIGAETQNEPSKIDSRVRIYLRRSNKIALRLKIELPLIIQDLKEFIISQLQITDKNIVLFCNGDQIDQKEKIENLKTNSIIHLIDIKKTLCPSLTIFFKEVANPSKVIKLKVSPSTPIKSVLEGELRSQIGKGQKKLFLVYIGKVLDNSKNFAEEFVEDESQLLVVQFKSKNNSKKLFKTINISHQQIKPQENQSVELLSPLKQNRGLADHQQWQQKIKQRASKNKKQAVSLQKIEVDGEDNEEEVAPGMKNSIFSQEYEQIAPFPQQFVQEQLDQYLKHQDKWLKKIQQ